MMKTTTLNTEEVEKMLKRLFNGGELRRLPKGRRDTEALLALAASSLDPRQTYLEKDLNEALKEWLEGFTYRTLDHVTIRRYLVDLNMLIRDERGSWYRTNQAVINTIIEPDARSIRPIEIYEAVLQERQARKSAIR